MPDSEPNASRHLQSGVTRPFTTDDLMHLQKEIFRDCSEIIERKNHDYSGGSGDPFSNFKAATTVGVQPELGLLMRCMDKFKRIQAFTEKGFLKVEDEPVDDAIRDVINYMVLLAGMIEEKREAQKEKAV